jgi:hypothetical protein
MTSSEIEQTCYERGFLFFTTHVSDPLAASVACTVLDVVARDGLVQGAHDLGTRLQERLHSLVDRNPNRLSRLPKPPDTILPDRTSVPVPEKVATTRPFSTIFTVDAELRDDDAVMVTV